MAHGEVIKPKLLIGADGLHSNVRVALNGVRKPFFTRQVAWRTVIPAVGDEPPVAKVFMGAGRHLVVYPLRGGTMLNIVAVQERDEWAAEGWNYEDDPANLRSVFADFGAEVQALLARVQKVYLWGLFRHPVAEHWHKGRVAILGDAAHPTLPFMAQGAVMALEDAWVLADALDKADSVEAGLAAYQNRRHARATKVIEAASKNARNYHLSPGPVRFAAHSALRLGSRIAPSLAMKKFDWIYGHDVTKP
jgi:salicylate hydroxylase